MPYYQRSWNAVLEDPPKQSKPLRTYPATEFAEKQDPLLEPPPQQESTRLDAKKVLAFRAQLSRRVKEIISTRGAEMLMEPTRGSSTSNINLVNNYEVRRTHVVWQGQHSTLYKCVKLKKTEERGILVARYFVPSAMLKADDLYLKILRYIGKKPPNIIHTLDIYLDLEKQHIILFQEYADQGNLLEYLRSDKQVSEEQMGAWAIALYKALDYLGDIGVAHRAIHPAHLFLKTKQQKHGHHDEGSPSSLTIKLSGFRDAILYWDPATGDILDQPCNPQLTFKLMYFQAPEMRGSEDQYYNPVDADVWSLGATLFFLVSRTYPYNVKKPANDLDGEIRNTIANCEALSDGAKYFLFGLMRTHTKMRTDFNAVKQDAWFLKQLTEESVPLAS